MSGKPSQGANGLFHGLWNLREAKKLGMGKCQVMRLKYTPEPYFLKATKSSASLFNLSYNPCFNLWALSKLYKQMPKDLLFFVERLLVVNRRPATNLRGKIDKKRAKQDRDVCVPGQVDDKFTEKTLEIRICLPSSPLTSNIPGL